MNPRAQRVWVLGHGFLGRVLAAHCRAAGAHVLSIDSAASAMPDLCADAAQTATLAVAAELSGGEPAVVYCCLATHGGSVVDYRRSYLATAQNLVAAGLAARCVFCSSTSLYSGMSERGLVLHQAESLVLDSGGAVARLAALYGSGRCELLRRHLAGEPCLAGSAERVLNYVHVEDAAAALQLLAKTQYRDICAVCGQSFTKAAVYELLEHVTGVPVSAQSAMPSRRVASTHAVSAQKLYELGWRPQHTFADFVAAEITKN